MGNETILYYVFEENITDRPKVIKPRFRQKIKPSSFVMQESGPEDELTIVTVVFPALENGWTRKKLLKSMQEWGRSEAGEYLGNTEIIMQKDMRKLYLGGPDISRQKGLRRFFENRISAPGQEKNFSSESGFAWENGLTPTLRILACRAVNERFYIHDRDMNKNNRNNDNINTKYTTNTKYSINTISGFQKTKKSYPDTVMLLMGTSISPEEQIRHFMEMIQPFLPYVNNLTIIYEVSYIESIEDIGDVENITDISNADDPESIAAVENGKNIPNTDIIKNNRKDIEDDNSVRYTENTENTIREAQKCLEELYYEYGLVGQLVKASERILTPFRDKNEAHKIFLTDYGYDGRLPYGMMKNGGTYLDIFSSEEKERRIKKKCSEISYISPLKYLDTLIKSGYDKLVNQT